MKQAENGDLSDSGRRSASLDDRPAAGQEDAFRLTLDLDAMAYEIEGREEAWKTVVDFHLEGEMGLAERWAGALGISCEELYRNTEKINDILGEKNQNAGVRVVLGGQSIPGETLSSLPDALQRNLSELIRSAGSDLKSLGADPERTRIRIRGKALCFAAVLDAVRTCLDSDPFPGRMSPEWCGEGTPVRLLPVVLALKERYLAVHILPEKKLVVFPLPYARGRVQVFQDVLQAGFAERNIALLSADHTVKVLGRDNDFGQKNTGRWRNITFIAACPSAVYGGSAPGVLHAGANPLPEVENWMHVRRCAASDTLAAGITETGRLLLAGAHPKEEMPSVVMDAAVCDGAAAVLASDGTVRFFGGRKDDERAAMRQFTNVRSLSLNGSYGTAVTKEGRVLLAGRDLTASDVRLREQMEHWKKVRYAAENSVLGAGITSKGALLLAGRAEGMTDGLEEDWNRTVRENIPGEEA